MPSSNRWLLVIALALGFFGAVFVANAENAEAKSDVLLLFDTTGSMDDAIDSAKDQALSVQSSLSARIPDIQFGVADLKDWPVDPYGDSGDYAWRLGQPITSNAEAVRSAINVLSASGGGDGPEAYGSALKRSDLEPSVGWRPGARRLVVLVADQVPHDNDLNEGVSFPGMRPSPFDTDVDVGPDLIDGTADDVDWQSLVAQLQRNKLTLLFVLFSGDEDYVPYWDSWAKQTGGYSVIGGGDDLGDKIIELVVGVSVPRVTVQPAIRGNPLPGASLTLANGDWTESPTGFGYQWERCEAGAVNCQAIAGATSANYVVRADDYGRVIRGVVTARNAIGSSVPAATSALAIADAPTSGKSVGVSVVTGSVLIRAPKSKDFLPIAPGAGTVIPDGSEIDVTNGRVAFSFVERGSKVPRTAEAAGSRFIFDQRPPKKSEKARILSTSTTELRLTEPLKSKTSKRTLRAVFNATASLPSSKRSRPSTVPSQPQANQSRKRCVPKWGCRGKPSWQVTSSNGYLAGRGTEVEVIDTKKKTTFRVIKGKAIAVSADGRRAKNLSRGQRAQFR